MTHPMVSWLNDVLDENERIARAAENEAASPWRTDGGRILHSGPIVDYMKDDQLWDSEGCTEYWRRLCMTENVVKHVALHDPASVLALVAAHRAILAIHEPSDWAVDEFACRTCSAEGEYPGAGRYPCPTVRALVSAFATRPEYLAEWGPQ